MPPQQVSTMSPCSAGRNVHQNLPMSSSSPSPRFLLLRRWEQQQHSALARAILSMNLVSSNRGGDSDQTPTSTAAPSTTTDASAAATTRETIARLLDEALMIVDAVPRSFESLQTGDVTNEEMTRRSTSALYANAPASSQSLVRPLTLRDYSPGPADDRAVVAEETVEIVVEDESDEAEPDSN